MGGNALERKPIVIASLAAAQAIAKDELVNINYATISENNYGNAIVKKTAATWVTETVYAAGAIVIPVTPGTKVYVAQNAGTTDTLEPTWGVTDNGGTLDGTVVWICKPLSYLDWVFTVTKPGVYDLNASAGLAAHTLAVGDKYELIVSVNDTQVAVIDRFTAQAITATYEVFLKGFASLRVETGDTIKVGIFHEFSASINTLADAKYNRLSIVKRETKLDQ